MERGGGEGREGRGGRGVPVTGGGRGEREGGSLRDGVGWEEEAGGGMFVMSMHV